MRASAATGACNADFAQALIAIARPLYAGDSFGLELAQTVYAREPV